MSGWLWCGGCIGNEAKTNTPKALGPLAVEEENHLWAEAGFRLSSEPFLHQHSHPARVVAGAGNLWHTSAHKGNPLFHRWAPVPNTVDLRGLLAARSAIQGLQAVRRPLVMNGRGSIKGMPGSATLGENCLHAPVAAKLGRDVRTVAEGNVRLGRPQTRGGCFTTGKWLSGRRSGHLG